MRTPLFASAVLVSWSLACAWPSSPPEETPAAPTGPRPEAELTESCFSWPDQEFSRNNHAEVELKLETGARAVDFTLESTKGDRFHLAERLAQKPVLLVQGSWTCPRFQEERAGLEATFQRFKNDIDMAIVYNIEAHPGAGDPSPYKGRNWTAEFSDRGQPKSFVDRLRNAREIARDSSMTVLVDRLEPNNANPFWCTYGTCAGCSWLIAKDGTIAAAHRWHDKPTMEASIEALLAQTAAK